MTDLGFFQDRIAEQQIRERIADAQAARTHHKPRLRGRHALARHLHHLADRFDG